MKKNLRQQRIGKPKQKKMEGKDTPKGGAFFQGSFRKTVDKEHN